jgi:hypothetical protein
MTNVQTSITRRILSVIQRRRPCNRQTSAAFGLSVGVVAFGLLLVVLLERGWPGEAPSKETAADSGQSESPVETIDPLSVNANCCLCHIPFVREEISKVHFAEKITCIKCHGLSAAHANDEDVGATKPDITYRRDQVDRMCRECHETHDAPAQAVVARFAERNLSDTSAICTDCHGHHRIEKPAEDAEHSEIPAAAAAK